MKSTQLAKLSDGSNTIIFKIYITKFFYVLSILLTPFYSIAQCNHPDDIAGLTAIYNALDGPNWPINSNPNSSGYWDVNCTSCDVCNWAGVEDFDNDGRVEFIHLNIPGVFELNGQIPSDISMLSELEVFNLSGENGVVTGSLPLSMSSLVKLKSLWIYRTQINGPIPDIFSNMIDLEDLYLYENNLNGTLPSHFISSMANLNSIKNISLRHNYLTGLVPSGLGNISNLTNLNLLYNDFSGCLPTDLLNYCLNGQTSIGAHNSNSSLPQYGGNNFDRVYYGEFCGDNLTFWNCGDSDAARLYEIYSSTGGTQWTNNFGWGEDNCDPCGECTGTPWFGVTCDANFRVIEVDLSNNNLSGTFPDLSYNGDPFVEFSGGLEFLEKIVLRDNNIKGPFPSQALQFLDNVTYLDLGENNFGENVSGSNLSLPVFSGISDLERLYLDNNGFINDSENSYSSFTNLEVLNLSHNDLTGIIPSSYSTFPVLQNLSLNNNSLSGPIPSQLADLSNTLSILRLQDNSLSGCYYPALHALCAVTSVDGHVSAGNTLSISWSTFCQIMDPNNCQQPDVPYLIDFYNNTNGANWTNSTGWVDGANGTNCDPCGITCDDPWYGITCDMGGNITEINLDNNGLTGSIPNVLHNLSSLTDLYFSYNSIGGTIPADLGTIPGLVNLKINHNNLSGDIPSNLISSSTFSVLDLQNNNLTGSIPASFGNSTSVMGLGLRNNNLCGCYDSSLSSLCSSLGMYSTDLWVSDGNNFDAPWEDFCSPNGSSGECGTGVIDCYHPDFEDLANFYIATGGTSSWINNNGWGSNCDPCGECNNTPWYGVTCVNNRVTEIDLQNNNLTGTLPSNIDGLEFLEKLRIHNNQIGGELPPDYVNLTNLTDFYAAYNNLTGAIPAEYCSFVPQQVTFTFSFNNLSECYDSALSCMCSIWNINARTSNGNNFPAPFSAFCATGDGDCSDNCMDFDGVDDYLSISNYSLPNNAFTISLWFKAIDNNNTYETRFFSMAGNGSILEIGVEDDIGATEGNLWIHDNFANPGIFATNQFVEDGNWHHVALVRSGTNGEVFLDGVSIHNYTTSGFPSNSYGINTRIGRYIGGATSTHLEGQVDDIAIWDRELLQGEIMELQTCELDGAEAGLDAFWDFNIGISEGDNTDPIFNTIPDQTGNGNDLTTQNLVMNGSASNLVSSTTGVYDACNCFAMPIAACKAQQTFSLDPVTEELVIDINDIDDGSSSACGSVTLSFDPNTIVTSLVFDCLDYYIGEHQINLYVTDNNGRQVSCNTTIEIESANLEIEALIDFYESTNGDMWSDNTGWLTNCDPCGMEAGNDPWFGIVCNILNRVDRLTLNQNNLDGKIPTSIGHLTELRWFIVGGNPLLTDSIPAEMCDLKDLLHLYVSHNNLNGEIPPCFTKIPNLVRFVAQNNQLEGEIPNFGDTLQLYLKNIQVENNMLEGSIPDSLINLPALEFLNVSNNDLDGCYNVSLLGLCQNSLIITNEDQYMSEGNNFDADWEDFCLTGEGSCCSNTEYDALVDFYISTNGDNWNNNDGWLTNCDPCGLETGNAPWFGLVCNSDGMIKQFGLTSNNLTGTLPKSINNFNEMFWFDVSRNSLTGVFPDICNWEDLFILKIGNSFQVGNNLFTGHLPICLNTFENLVEVLAEYAGFGGPLPNFDPATQNLINLRVDGNGLTGNIPESYSSFNWGTLDISHNNLDGCYDYRLFSLNETNADISDGNNFDAPWEDFVSSGDGQCCDADIILDAASLVSGVFSSSSTITVSGCINPPLNITFNAPTVIYNIPFEVKSGATVTTLLTGCH